MNKLEGEDVRKILLIFPLDILLWQIHFVWFTHVLVTVAPPFETLLTRFRTLQPSPLDVGDHLILKGIPAKSDDLLTY